MNKESRLIKIWSGFFALCHHCLLDAAVLNVTNELHLSRMGETVELPWKELEARVPGISPSAISVVDEKNV